MVDILSIEAVEALRLIETEESYFFDVKSRDVSPAKLSKTLSAFANASGGEVLIGVEEFEGADGPERSWLGFSDQEDANPIFQMMETIDPLSSTFQSSFIRCDKFEGYILQIICFKSRDIIKNTSSSVYIRRNASNLPVNGEALERLKYEKGIISFEDEFCDASIKDVANSECIIEFLLDVVPSGEPEIWLEKQRVVRGGRVTVAGVLLYSDGPQDILPKRSAVKILRYQTKEGAERDFLAFDPITIEGPIYDLIYDAVDKVKEIIDSIEKLGPKGLEPVSYPQDALHEILTNAVLHRDYSIASDVQIRIFDNRLEIESPGRLPGHVTLENIAKTQFARNPKLVRLINKFKNPPNKDVGEGINTAFEAMEKLRLKKPLFQETDSSLLVTLKHESLASPETMVMEYLVGNEEITNQIARDLTGIKSENSMKQVFYRLREAGQLEQTPKIKGKKPSWRRPTNDAP